MKFKGKVAIWYWAVCILAEGTMIYSFFVEQEAKIFLGISQELIKRNPGIMIAQSAI